VSKKNGTPVGMDVGGEIKFRRFFHAMKKQAAGFY